MARIKIKSEGIGAIYQKDNIWKILYPFGDGHEVKISFKSENNDQPTELGSFGSSNTTLEFLTTKEGESAEKGYSFPTLFDLTSKDYGHTSGVKIKDSWKEKGVLFEIHNATINVVTTNSSYEVKKGNLYIPLGHIGYSITAVIDLDDEETFMLNANGKQLFETQVGQSYDIWVNNNCPDETSEVEATVDRELRNTTDLVMLYNILEDKGNPDFRLSVIRDRRDLPLPSKNLNLRFLNTNPFPLEDGKPCYINQIGEIDETFL